MKALRDSATPSSLKAAGPTCREGGGFVPSRIISHQADGCRHLLNDGLSPQIHWVSGWLQLSPWNGVAQPRVTPVSSLLLSAVHSDSQSLLKALCQIRRQDWQVVTCSCHSREVRWKHAEVRMTDNRYCLVSFPTLPWEKEGPWHHGWRLLWGQMPRSEPLLCQILHMTLDMLLSLSNVVPQNLVPGPEHGCHPGAHWQCSTLHPLNGVYSGTRSPSVSHAY